MGLCPNTRGPTQFFGNENAPKVPWDPTRIWVKGGLTSIPTRILKDHILVFWTIIWSFNFPPPEGKNKKTIFLVS